MCLILFVLKSNTQKKMFNFFDLDSNYFLKPDPDEMCTQIHIVYTMYTAALLLAEGGGYWLVVLFSSFSAFSIFKKYQ